MQSELRRVGCLSGNADGNWNTASQRSLTLFNRYAKTNLDTKLASTDALDVIKNKPSRVCPLVCEHGYRTDGNSCTRIVCAQGSFLNDDNECEKRRDRKPVARRDTDDRERTAPLRPQAKQLVVRPHQPPTSGSAARPLTGLERQQGCDTYGAIMSGVCP